MKTSAMLAAASWMAMAAAAAAQESTVSGATAPMLAQPGGKGSDPTQIAANEEDIVVTGSRIARPNLDASVPVTTIAAELVRDRGNVSLGDQLNRLPQLGSTFSQSNSTRFIGTAGLNLLDLRRLGTARTLVLVNGRRHVTSQPGVNSVDINTIPTDLVDKIDIVTGGNSAIYGSDAVAGVVNFVLKRDFEGLRVNGQGGVSSRGDRPSYFASAIAGKNFSEGRGNVSVAFEYASQEALYYTDRDSEYGAFSGRNQFQLVQNTGPQLNPSNGAIRTTPEPATGDGVPDNIFLRGIRNVNISEGGLFTAACPVVAAAGESAAAFMARRAAACSGLPNQNSTNALAQYGRTFVFNEAGRLVPNNCLQDFRPVGSTNCIGGLGSTLRLTGQLNPGLTRYATNLLAHYDFSRAFRAFVEAKFVRIDAIQEGQPTFNNNTFSINNPFLDTASRALLTSVLAPGVTNFTAQRFNIDFGGRGENHQRDLYRVVAGIGGDFAPGQRYELSFNYGRFESFYESQGNTVTARYANSINAVRNAAGQIVCSINNDASTTNDDPNCVPVNLFGTNSASREALNYFGYTSSRKQNAEQLVANGFIAGNSQPLFSLPGGPIGYSLGGEWRRETSFSAFDAFTQSGATFLNSIPTFAPPALEVTEGFAEVRLPLLKNLPFVRELTIEAAARVSNYNIGRTGTVFTYNAGGVYSPVNGFRIRGNYSVSVRAPTQTDLFGARSQTFLNGLVDPCGQSNINNNPNRRANCAAAGVPTTQQFQVGVTPTGAPILGPVEPFQNVPASGISGVNSGNRDLNAEEGRSWTVGGVFTPKFLPGVSLTVDYYNIDISNVIFSLLPQTIINQCYDNPGGIANPFCASIFRNSNGTFLGQGNVQYNGATLSLPANTGVSFVSQPFNFARQRTEGIDFVLQGQRRINPDWSAGFFANIAWVIRRDNYTDVTRPNFIQQQRLNVGDPEWNATINANVTYKAVQLNYDLRILGRQTIGLYEAQNSVQGRAPENPDQFSPAYYPVITTSNLRVAFTPTQKTRFYIGVDNLFDQAPPFGLDGTGAGGGIYDNVQRFFYAGATFRY